MTLNKKKFTHRLWCCDSYKAPISKMSIIWDTFSFSGIVLGIQQTWNKGEAGCTSDAKRNKTPQVRGLNAQHREQRALIPWLSEQ